MDIVDAVKFAREQELEVAVRGGGHNVAWRATIDGGVMIDLSSMKGIHVDPEARTTRSMRSIARWTPTSRASVVEAVAASALANGDRAVAVMPEGPYGLSICAEA